MKIAIFHNYLDNIGGAEVVSLTLARELKADIYTTNIDKEKIEKMGFKDVLPNIFSIGSVPVNAPYKQQLSLLKFRMLNLKNSYDFYIIDGDWAMSGAVKNKPNLWYIHSPIREIWDLYEYTRSNMVRPLLRPAFDLWVTLNRYLNRKYIKQVGILACNSCNTQSRLKKFLGTSASVIYPPVYTDRFKFKKFGDYWLSVNRLISHKRIVMQLESFSKMPEENLVIVGSYEQSKHFKEYADLCKRIKSSNVKIISWANQDELINLYANCKGLLTTSLNEDFGMNVIEAMASGKPVIAPNEGGYMETVINGKTGILIDKIDSKKINESIKSMSQKISANPEDIKKTCQDRAREFDVSVFIDKIKSHINYEK